MTPQALAGVVFLAWLAVLLAFDLAMFVLYGHGGTVSAFLRAWPLASVFALGALFGHLFL